MQWAEVIRWDRKRNEELHQRQVGEGEQDPGHPEEGRDLQDQGQGKEGQQKEKADAKEPRA